MTSQRLSTWWIVIAVSVLVAACLPAAHRLRGIPNQPTKEAADLPLTDQHGQPFMLQNHRGKVLAVYFGYTYCPDVCPITLAQLAQVWRSLSDEEARRFQPIFVTVDPERDTEELLTRYLARFDSAVGNDLGLAFIGLRGDSEALQRALAGYGAEAYKRPQPGSATGYTVDHTASIFIIDAAGQLVERFPYGSATEDILADIRYLIQKGSR